MDQVDPAPQQIPQCHIEIVIKCEIFSGQIHITGPITNPGLCFAALELAKQEVISFNKGHGILIPTNGKKIN
jgi:hypothetical protein